MNGSHARVLDLVAADAAFPLVPEERQALDQHLAQCTSCAAAAGGLRADAAAIARLDPPMPPRLHDRIREIAMTPPRRRTSIGALVAIAVLTLAAAGAAIGAGGVADGLAALVGPQVPSPPAVPAESPGEHLPANGVRVVAGDTVLTADGIWIDTLGTRAPVTVLGLSTSDDPTGRWQLRMRWAAPDGERIIVVWLRAETATWGVARIDVLNPRTTNAAVLLDTEILGPRFQSLDGGATLPATPGDPEAILRLEGLRLDEGSLHLGG